MSPTKNQLFLLLLLTVIKCKQRYIRTSLPCNVTCRGLVFVCGFIKSFCIIISTVCK
jgi:hypothetical protein